MRGLVAAALRRQPLEIHTAANGAEALRLLEQHEYAVVLVDLMMPQVDGFTLIDTMARATPRPSTVVLVMTAFDDSMLLRLDARIVHAILRKPFDLDHLVELVTDCASMRAWQADDTEVRHGPRPGEGADSDAVC